MRGEEGEVVRLAVLPSVLLEEVATAQLRLTLGAHKVLRVPNLPERRHHLHEGAVSRQVYREDLFPLRWEEAELDGSVSSREIIADVKLLCCSNNLLLDGDKHR